MRKSLRWVDLYCGRDWHAWGLGVSGSWYNKTAWELTVDFGPFFLLVQGR